MLARAGPISAHQPHGLLQFSFSESGIFGIEKNRKNDYLKFIDPGPYEKGTNLERQDTTMHLLSARATSTSLDASKDDRC